MKCTRARSAKQIELQPYLVRIKDQTLLTASEEFELAEAIARGDRNALSRMIQANLRLVVRIAGDYVGRGLTLDDLVGEGNLGLIRAAEQFKSRFGTRFSTYASYWIKQSIRQALCNSTAMIRLPAHVLGLLGKWRKAERALGRELSREPSFNEVASHLGLSETQKLLMARAKRARHVKLESAVGRTVGRWSLVEPCDPYGPPEVAVECLEDKLLLRTRLECLDGKERIIVSLRFGLNDEIPMTLREIGDRLGVTREWVRRIELKAVRKLRGEAPELTRGLNRDARVTNAARRARTAAANVKSSTYETKTRTPSCAGPRDIGRARPSPPAVPLPMAPSVWDDRWRSISAPIVSTGCNSLSTS